MARWVRPTLNTKYHIDFDWWKEQNLNFRVFLRSQLCEDCEANYKEHHASELVDWVDPATGEVKRVDALWQALKSCCSQRKDYVTETIPITTAIFRLFLANDNTPLTTVELVESLGRGNPEQLLRTLSRGQVYRGIKPVPVE